MPLNDQQLGQVIAHLHGALRALESAEHMAKGMPISVTLALDAVDCKLQELEGLRAVMQAQVRTTA
jgi:hypothetical protein